MFLRQALLIGSLPFIGVASAISKPLNPSVKVMVNNFDATSFLGYLILKGNDPFALADVVNQLLDDNFTLVGGLAIVADSNGEFFYQAMARTELLPTGKKKK